MEQQKLKNIIEAVLMSAEKPMKVNQIEALFAGDVDMPARNDIRKALQDLAEDYKERGFELKEVASGFRIQVGQDYAEWVGRLWEEKPARYTRALLETLALIAYRQPITRGEIEEVRGVSVSSNIIKTLQEREWIKVLGHKDVPGKPALYGTSKEFLDYFNLKSLEDLPTLAELKDLDQIHQELDLDIDSAATGEGEQQGDQQPPEDAAQAETEVTVQASSEDSDGEADAAAAETGDTETVAGAQAETEHSAPDVNDENDDEAAEPVSDRSDTVTAEVAQGADAGDQGADDTADEAGTSEKDTTDAQNEDNDANVVEITAVENDVVEDDVDEEEAQPQSVAG